jgi:hypothetical protein
LTDSEARQRKAIEAYVIVEWLYDKAVPRRRRDYRASGLRRHAVPYLAFALFGEKLAPLALVGMAVTLGYH